MQIIDLFSGIGGFSLAGEWIDWKTVQFCEQDNFCQKVLSHHFLNVPISSDIRQLNYETIKQGNWNPSGRTILTGGFPCQPFSLAGRREGANDHRHLWPEMLRVIREVRPDWVVGENVIGLTNMAFPERKVILESEAYRTEEADMVLAGIIGDLEGIGYSVQAFIIPACGVGAAHRRDRVWIVAHTDIRPDSENTREYAGTCGKEGLSKRHEIHKSAEPGSLWQNAPHSQCIGGVQFIKGGDSNTNEIGIGEVEKSRRDSEPDGITRSDESLDSDSDRQRQQECIPSPIARELGFGFGLGNTKESREYLRLSEPPICGTNDGFTGRVDGYSQSGYRTARLKALGNAIVPQLAYEIFKAISIADDESKNRNTQRRRG